MNPSAHQPAGKHRLVATLDDSDIHPAPRIDLLSHVALACMQQLIAHKERLLGDQYGEVSPEDAEAMVASAAFSQAEAFLAERQKRLASASGLNENAQRVSEGV